ncbi:MAG: N-acetylmuramoyl-L-alanine amidase [Clostridia bacterium]|nr:N-acetylmuramoyl-L-alanine amidase [Clostridia bacterium]
MAIRIYIDQGHNPVNPNAGAEGNGYREQDLVYTIGTLLYERLEADSDFEARLSRPTPTTQIGVSNATSLRVRVEQANAWGADLFLSLHTNASSNSTATGVEGLVFRLGSTAADIADDLVKGVVRATGLRNRGVKARPGIYVLKRTTMPAVLMELGFITNPRDAALMANSPNLFADGLYNGLRAYYGV